MASPPSPSPFVDLLIQRWYIFALAILVVVVLALLLRNRNGNKREYWDEIKQHQQVVKNEMKFNPTDYKFVYFRMPYGKDVPLGKIIGLKTNNVKFSSLTIDDKSKRTLDPREIRMSELRNIALMVTQNKPMEQIIKEREESEKRERLFEEVTMTVQTDCLTLPLIHINFWYGEEKIYNMLASEMELSDGERIIYVANDIGFTYRNGHYLSKKQIETQAFFVEMEIYRTLHDKTLNAMGYQSQRLAEIKNEYAQALNLKEKDAEIEQEKRKSMLERG